MRTALPVVLVFALAFVAPSTGCVKKSTHQALQAQYDTLAAENRQRGTRIQTLTQEVATLEARIKSLEGQHAALLKDKAHLTDSVADMTQALEELKRRKAAAEARIAEYRDLLSRFKALIDAGKLKVRIIDGRMVVELRTDILFSSGSASLSSDGKEAIREVTGVLASIPKREFQIAGHTDNVPMRGGGYRSNWDLAAGRALTVVNTMVDAGMPPERVSAAGFGEYRPVAPNDTAEGKAQNRRIEIVVVPDMSQLPGAKELEKIGGDG